MATAWLLPAAGAAEAPSPVPTAPPVLDTELTPPPPVRRPELREHFAGSCEQRHGERPEMIERARTQIEQTVCGAALWFDGLFGERRNLDAARGAYGRLETSLEYSSFYGLKSRTRFNVRVDLPNLEDRVSVFIGRDNEDDFARDRSEGFALRSEFPQVDDRDQFFAGFGFSPPSSERFRSDIKVGVRNVREPRAFVQARMEYLGYADDTDLLQFRLTPFYNTRDGFGVTPGVDFSRVLSPRLLFRWSTIGTYSEITTGFDWRSALLLYQGIGWERGLAYEAFVRGLTETEVPVREYGLRLVFRQPLLQHRLYLQPLLGYSWPKEEPTQSRRGAYLVGVGVELPFGRRRDRLGPGERDADAVPDQPDMPMPNSELQQADDAKQDEIAGDDVVEQTGKDEDEDAGDQGDQRRD